MIQENYGLGIGFVYDSISRNEPDVIHSICIEKNDGTIEIVEKKLTAIQNKIAQSIFKTIIYEDIIKYEVEGESVVGYIGLKGESFQRMVDRNSTICSK